jgi:hypothetical protein
MASSGKSQQDDHRAIHFRTATVRLPPMRSKSHGYEQSPIAQPGRGAVLLTRRTGRTLARCQLATGRVEQVGGIAGELRDAVFDPDGQRAWLLAIYGLCQVTLEPLAITRVVRAGLGTFKNRVCALGREWLGIFNSRRITLIVVDRATGQVRTTLRFPGPDLVLPGPVEHTVWLVALRDGQAGLLHLGSLRISQRRRLLKVVAPVVAGQEVLAVADQATLDGAPTDRFGRPSRERVVALGIDAFELRRHGPKLPGLVAVLGVDAAGRPVAATHQGFIILDRATLAPLARFELDRPIQGACHVPDTDTDEDAVVLVPSLEARAAPTGGREHFPEELVVVRWHR